MSDGFVLQSLFEEAGEENVEGAYGTAPTLNPDDLPGEGAAFIESTRRSTERLRCTRPTPWALQVILAALEASDGTREGVTEQLFQVSTDTVIRPISFDENGDPAEEVRVRVPGQGRRVDVRRAGRGRPVRAAEKHARKAGIAGPPVSEPCFLSPAVVLCFPRGDGGAALS